MKKKKTFKNFHTKSHMFSKTCDGPSSSQVCTHQACAAGPAWLQMIE